MPWPRMTTRQLMVAVAVVAVVCGVLSGLAGMETFPWWLVGLLAMTFGFYLAAAFACGLVLDLIAPLGQRADQPRDEPSTGHHTDAKPDV
jgi:cyanate permease